MNNINFKGYLDEQLEGPVSKKEFENETTKLESTIALTKARKESGLSQRDLAVASDVPQPAIARIESGTNTSIDTLTKIANVLGKRLTVSFS